MDRLLRSGRDSGVNFLVSRLCFVGRAVTKLMLFLTNEGASLARKKCDLVAGLINTKKKRVQNFIFVAN